MPVLRQIEHLDYGIDIVMCIDASHSMSSIIEEVKANVLSFPKKVVEVMHSYETETPKVIKQLRIKVIVFRDNGANFEPILESEFFTLYGDIDESDKFHEFVEKIVASDGNEASKNSLKALELAIKSDWVSVGTVNRHVILMYTNSSESTLGDGAEQTNYSADTPEDLEELRELWEGQCVEKRTKRLFLFAPDVAPWSDVADWRNAFIMALPDSVRYDDMVSCIKLALEGAVK
jgi:hypothetical protein